MIVAKPIVPNRFWILKENDRKIGNIEAKPGGFAVKINNHISTYQTLNNIKRNASINFEPAYKTIKQKQTNQAYGFATSSRPHNVMYNVKHQVPLWTKEPKSKSWYAAGWFSIKQGRQWETVFCPKLITIERYQFKGPFYTEEQANNND